MELEFFVKAVYGRKYVYLAQPGQREAMEKLTGKKTLEAEGMEALKVFGFTFKQVITPLE
jgi:hypothetical protein